MKKLIPICLFLVGCQQPPVIKKYYITVRPPEYMYNCPVHSPIRIQTENDVINEVKSLRQINSICYQSMRNLRDYYENQYKERTNVRFE